MIKPTVFPIFPTALGAFELEDERHVELKKACLELIDSENCSSIYPDHGARNLTHYRDGINDNLFAALPPWVKGWFLECVTFFAEEVLEYALIDGIQLHECWLNKCDQNGYQDKHNHANSLITGTYYVNFIEQIAHAPLEMEKRPVGSTQPFFALPRKGLNEFNSEVFTVPCREGVLFLWESHLGHGYKDNQGDNRITISFNAFPKFFSNGQYTFRIAMDKKEE